MSWITEHWKEKFEEGKIKGRELKKKHKNKLKELIKKNE